MPHGPPLRGRHGQPEGQAHGAGPRGRRVRGGRGPRGRPEPRQGAGARVLPCRVRGVPLVHDRGGRRAALRRAQGRIRLRRRRRPRHVPRGPGAQRPQASGRDPGLRDGGPGRLRHHHDRHAEKRCGGLKPDQAVLWCAAATASATASCSSPSTGAAPPPSPFPARRPTAPRPRSSARTS